MQRSIRMRLTAGAALAAGFIHPAFAEVHFNGFGQVVVGSTLDNSKAFPNLDYSDEATFKQESLFALQANAPLADKLSATVQVQAKGSTNFETKFSWAYVSYQASSDWSLKAGRQRVPAFNYSDYLDVGVAYPWIRPPVAVYGGSDGLSNIDALSVNYSHSYGDWQIDPSLLFGSYDGASGDGAEVKLSNFVAASVRAVYNDWLNLRLGYVHNSLSVSNTPVDPLIAGLRSAGLSAAADDIAVENDLNTFYSAALEINRANWLLIGEYTRVSAPNSFIGQSDNWYVALGRHFGKLLPLFTYSSAKSKPDTKALSEIPSSHPAYSVLYPGAAAVVNSADAAHHYYEFGLRYDLLRNVALKADYTRHNPRDGEGANLFSAAVAFTF